MVREVIEGQDVIFYDEMRTPRENWHSRRKRASV
jgi:hypothetical protein